MSAGAARAGALPFRQKGGTAHAGRPRYRGHAALARLRRRDQRRRSDQAALQGHGRGDQGRLGQAPRAGVPRPEGHAGRPASLRLLFRRSRQPQEGAGGAAQPAPKACSRTTRRFCSSATSRSTASRSAPSARASSGSTSIPAIRRSPTSTRSSMRSSCRRPAATPCSPTCTRPTRRCRRAQGEAQRQEGAAHPRIQSRQAGELLGRHQRHPALLPSGLHHASRHRPQDAVRRPADDDAHRGLRARPKATRSSISSTTSASGASSSSSTSGSSAIS